MQITPCKWSLWGAIISMAVIACLCFSIGEGLRLTPFPVADTTQTETSNDSDTSVRKYGPIDVPTRTKNRKRQLVDYAYSAPQRSFREHRSIAFDRNQRIDVPSLPLGSHPSGRAPPAC
jgi:hypothetical protein